MADWPAPDQLDVWQGLPRPPAPGSTRAEMAGRIALSRFRDGLPVSDAIIEELFALADRDGEARPGTFTEREREEIRGDRQRTDRVREVVAGADAGLSRIELCWLAGRRGVRVFLTGDQDRYRQLLVEALGADRVAVLRARFSEREMTEFSRRLREAMGQLAEQGILISTMHPEPDAYKVNYFAADPARAERTLRERFGAFAAFEYLGASRYAIRPQPFGSWLASGNDLHVFYGLGRNGEQPASCSALEFDDSVVVAVLIRDLVGVKTLIGGFTRSHCTITLSRPLGDRAVIDNADNVARPHWTIAANTSRHRSDP